MSGAGSREQSDIRDYGSSCFAHVVSLQGAGLPGGNGIFPACLI